MIFLTLFLNQFLFSQWGQPLSVDSVKFELVSHRPSCRLLKYRALEREKVIRELKHLMGLDSDDSAAHFMDLDYLINNKLFLDHSLWDDYSARIRFEVKIDDNFKNAANQYSFNNLFISLNAPGLSWTSHPDQTPQELSIEYNKESGLITVSYPLYLNSYCLSASESPEVRWFGPNDGPVNFEDSYSIVNMILESFNKL